MAHLTGAIAIVIKAMKIAQDVPVCEAVNVGTGRNYSLNELVTIINEVLGKKIEPVYREVDIPNYVQDTLADTAKMVKMLGGHKVELREGIVRIISKHTSLM